MTKSMRSPRLRERIDLALALVITGEIVLALAALMYLMMGDSTNATHLAGVLLFGALAIYKLARRK